MKRACQILLHVLGLACIAACLGIVLSKGALNIHGVGWVAVGYFLSLSLGILCGWFPWRGKPVQVLVKGVYTMSALALIGFGFKLDDPWRPELWIVLAVPAAAISLRIILKIVFHLRENGGNDDKACAPDRKLTSAGDSFSD